MNVNELNNDGEAPEGVAADGAAAAVAVAEANAEADALTEEINAAARHYDARFLEQERQVLHIALIRCGIRHGDARERFMDGQGIGPVMSLAWMTKKDIEKMVEYHNSTLTNTIAHRPLRLGLMHARRVYALAYHVTQLQAQGKLFRLEDWSMEKADELLQRIALQEDTKSMDPPTLGKIKTGLDWYDWEKEWFAYTTCIPSVLGTDGGIAYVGRRDRADPLAPFTSDLERNIYANRLEGLAFEKDNHTYFVHLQSKVSNTPDAVWLRAFESKHDGRGAIMKLREVHEGEDAISRRVTVATHVLAETGVSYRGEYHDPDWTSYVAKLEQALHIMELHQQPYTERMKVDRLIKGIKCNDHVEIVPALRSAKDNHMDNYDACKAYLGTVMSQVFPEKSSDQQRKRIGGNSPRKVGKVARKGAGRGGGGHKKSFNGVDCSDVARKFSVDEWDRMGEDGRRFIQSQRSKKKSPKTNSTETRRVKKVSKASEEPGETAEDDEVVADETGGSTKGGRAGNSFGKNARGK
jgi:hypothetical protein